MGGSREVERGVDGCEIAETTVAKGHRQRVWKPNTDGCEIGKAWSKERGMVGQ